MGEGRGGGERKFGRVANKTRQDKTRQDKDKTRTRQGQDKTRQDKTRQDKTRQDKTRQDKTRQDKTRQAKTRQDKTIARVVFLTSSLLFHTHYAWYNTGNYDLIGHWLEKT